MKRCFRTVPLSLVVVACLLICLLLVILPLHSVRASQDRNLSATAVWGQPNFVAVDRHCSHATSMSLCGPTQVVPDAQGNLWVADLVHNRVLMFPPGSAIASRVLGQYGSMTTRDCDQSPPPGSPYPSAPNRYTLCQPAGLAIDVRGTLYVADSLNNRILVYFDAAHKPADAPADRVLGQPSFHASASNGYPARGYGASACYAPRPASACGLNSPMELSFTSHGDLLVPDLDNHRVLLWSESSLHRLQSPSCVPTCSLPASRVWGQYGSFRTNTINNPFIPTGVSSRCTAITPSSPASPCTLSEPWSAIGDQKGNLYIADTANNRVLEYDDGLENGRQDAGSVYGQGGRFDTIEANPGGVRATTLWHPIGLTLEAPGTLWITDFYNMRALGFDIHASAPSQVLGQGGGFDSNSCRTSAAGLCGPTSVAFDAAGHAFVTDGFNNRVLELFSPPVALARVDRLSVTRHRSYALIRWHSAGPIRGFDLYLGRKRLSDRLLVPDRRGNCQDKVHWQGRGSFTLHVVLNGGQVASVVTS